MQEQQHSVSIVVKSLCDELCDELYISKCIGRVWNDFKTAGVLMEKEEALKLATYAILDAILDPYSLFDPHKLRASQSVSLEMCRLAERSQ